MLPFTPRRALLSVSNKTGLVDIATTLHQHHIELVATGNTASLLRQANLPVTEVSDCTHFPEILDGRVKTLHPAIHAGLLARGKQDQHILKQHAISPFDILIVNLYPFEQVISDPDCKFSEAIENIDIGGPAMIRAAAKNHAHLTVIVNPHDYQELAEYVNLKKMPKDWRFNLAKKAFAHTAAYDAAISNYLNALNDEKTPSGFPTALTCQFNKQYDLRYGENPHQQAIFYTDKNALTGSLALAKVIQGKALSYNNLLDADAALDCVRAFSTTTSACVIVKHGNPCGIALANNQLQAYQRAYQTDPVSSYGGILAFNQCLEEDTVSTLLATQFAEVIIAPIISDAAKKVLATKPNIRVLETGNLPVNDQFKLDMRHIDGGFLVQEHDNFPIDINKFTTVTEKRPTKQQQQDLLFAWQAVKYVKSNAIVLAKDLATIGIGAGQTSRVMSTRIALWQAEQAGFSSQDSVLASDAFFPFPDSIELIAQAGVTAIIQPGGSIRDEQIIAAANAANIAMIFTGMRHFRH
ncbi:bifunctional phosphoribosylaminoimidazolecarboxamide formyltransferase/IMP cyclohydrolase [Legionella gresilensis]|uniref:bifunctional phosphoribosylaminoimidazolecarboxamide formyltransferase/IMP cyclohydrolase n=1 Tax=Legionella gresilensis TaxID=91823 RepID=UPI001041475D|nr:bifunctional phosphoribosylaminoimidazolecarboxamide formyltransferase/IMP cyclohydrolase [Legionella gresilensis]